MIVFIIFIILFLPTFSSAVEITSDTLERFEEEKKYVATGNVTMIGETFKLQADKAAYYEDKNEIDALGNIFFEDEDLKAWAHEGNINVDKKTGVLRNALIHIKKQDIWIGAEEIERLSEIKYKAKKATFSTCEPEKDRSQPWCFTAETVNLVIDETLLASATTFKVKNIPIAFSPIFWGPGGNTKKSGFLPLKLGNSNTRGFQISPAYYLVIDSNKDATFYIDYFSKTGIGKGIEYRYLSFDTKGMWYAYQINDRVTDKNYQELRGVHLQKLKGLDLLIDINYVNKKDFYKEYGDVRAYNSTYLFRDYGKDLQAKYDRFLQSSLELSAQAVGGRFYLLGQGWKDLKNEGMSLPVRGEFGYVVYPYKLGPLNVSFNANIGEYYKEDGLKGQRLELNPQITNTIGDSIKLAQNLNARAIFYNLEKTSPYNDVSNREMIQYNAKAFMRLYKTEDSFTHIIEPFIEGVFIGVNSKPPILKDAELIDDTAIIRAGVYNKLNFNNISLEGRIAQVYDFRAKGDWDKLYPILIEAKASFWKVSLGFDTYQNMAKKRMERLNSWISFSPDENTSLSFSQRYTRDGALNPSYLWAPTLREQYDFQETEGGIKTYAMTLVKKISEKWSFSGNINYDSKGAGLRDSYLQIRYTEKCWASNITLSRKPVIREGRETSEFNVLLIFELKGIGAIKLL
ncbi:MAG: hypothetical protein N2647_02525 [Thermodesulfovibrio sp.]|nr:hypothetical protein [Thermodesulfovibrio sp.]